MRDSTDGRFPVSPYIPWMALSQTEDHRADAGWDGEPAVQCQSSLRGVDSDAGHPIRHRGDTRTDRRLQDQRSPRSTRQTGCRFRQNGNLIN